MDALIEAADTWLAILKAVQSAAVGKRLLQRLKGAPREETGQLKNVRRPQIVLHCSKRQ
jgi:hypothetical protein